MASKPWIKIQTCAGHPGAEIFELSQNTLAWMDKIRILYLTQFFVLASVTLDHEGLKIISINILSEPIVQSKHPQKLWSMERGSPSFRRVR